jgi:hypothetical protein
MKRYVNRIRPIVTLGALLTLVGINCASPAGSDGNSPESDDSAKAEAIILESPDGFAHFTLTGTTADFGRYLAIGEATFVPGEEEGVLMDGIGIAVVQAENDDQIVADVTCGVTDDGLDFTFHWRDSVTFSTGSTATNTGAFVDNQPPGLFLSRIRGRKFNDTTLHCRLCCFSVCNATGCTFSCGTHCFPASAGDDPCPSEPILIP